MISRDGGQLAADDLQQHSVCLRERASLSLGEADPVFLSARHRDPAIAPGAITRIQFRGLVGECEGAINLHSEPAGLIQRILLTASSSPEAESTGGAGLYDVRPPCNRSRRPAGMDNARVFEFTAAVPGVEPTEVAGAVCQRRD